MVEGHILAVACEVLGVTKLDCPLQLPPGLRESNSQSQLSFLRSLALQVVDRCTLVGAALTRDKVDETELLLPTLPPTFHYKEPLVGSFYEHQRRYGWKYSLQPSQCAYEEDAQRCHC